jgi:hypothetical protein
MPLALLDSTERKRTSPARCRMHRTIARWTNGNPLMFHKAHSDPVTTCGIRMSLHYTGLSGKAMLKIDGGPPETIHLDATRNALINVRIPARSRTFLIFSAMTDSE